jgi:site-specific DNA-methyltransferase (adenine-specific)
MNYKDKFQDKDKNITLYNMDCMELLKNTEDNYFKVAIVDPPYGIGYAKRKSKTKTSKIQYTPKDWDNEAPTKEYFKELFRVSENQIIWGGNYFELPTTRCFVIWDKCQPEGLDQAMCEFAWCSFNKSAKIYKTSVQQMQFTRIHPTQKPIKLYEWLLQNYAKEGDKILDTHLGSGSIAIACNRLKFELTASELDTEYFESSVKRYKEQTAQIQLF